MRIRAIFFHTISGRLAEHVVSVHETVTLGRQHVADLLGLEEPTISKRHVQLHPVVYDQSDASVEPMLYVKSLSRNVTTIVRHCEQVDATELDTTKVNLTAESHPQLINDGDVLHLSPVVHVEIRFLQKSLHYQALHDSELLPDTQLREAEMFDWAYRITPRRIGFGGHGSVYVAINVKTNRQVACKVVDMHKYSVFARDEALAEVREGGHRRGSSAFQSTLRERWQDLLQHKLRQCSDEQLIQKDLSHPNIVTTDKVSMTTHSLFLFQELITGGDLFSYIDNKGASGLPDAEATIITFQLLQAVRYLHEQGIVHRDIKPENILMASWRPGGRVVLIDFGLAKRLEAGNKSDTRPLRQRMHTLVGTYEYAAPEVNSRDPKVRAQGYNSSIDLWSVGTIAALLLTGEQLFSRDTGFTTTTNARQGMFSPDTATCDLSALDDTNHLLWGPISRRPKDFIKKLLVLDEDERLTAQQALKHSWFTKKYYKADLNALYQNAISDWKPNTPLHIEFVDTSRLGPGPLDDDSVLDLEEPRSYSTHFPRHRRNGEELYASL